mmetsp:Transcript_82272/g.236418  ORF Transcript_82272/g.236418 Transcript_82272/m.236418 type:complete len:232 (-) Transcript_82272:80-775(-)
MAHISDFSVETSWCTIVRKARMNRMMREIRTTLMRRVMRKILRIRSCEGLCVILGSAVSLLPLERALLAATKIYIEDSTMELITMTTSSQFHCQEGERQKKSNRSAQSFITSSAVKRKVYNTLVTSRAVLCCPSLLAAASVWMPMKNVLVMIAKPKKSSNPPLLTNLCKLFLRALRPIVSCLRTHGRSAGGATAGGTTEVDDESAIMHKPGLSFGHSATESNDDLLVCNFA